MRTPAVPSAAYITSREQELLSEFRAHCKAAESPTRVDLTAAHIKAWSQRAERLLRWLVQFRREHGILKHRNLFP